MCISAVNVVSAMTSKSDEGDPQLSLWVRFFQLEGKTDSESKNLAKRKMQQDAATTSNQKEATPRRTEKAAKSKTKNKKRKRSRSKAPSPVRPTVVGKARPSRPPEAKARPVKKTVSASVHTCIFAVFSH